MFTNFRYSPLVNQPSIFDWQRFHLWKLATQLPSIPQPLLEQALIAAGDNRSVAVAAQAIVCAGRHGTNTIRELLFGKYFLGQRGFLVQRAVLIAIQGLPDALRIDLYSRALRSAPEHKELIDFLLTRHSADYGLTERPARKCGEAKALRAQIHSGIGNVRGFTIAFNISGGDYDYD